MLATARARIAAPSAEDLEGTAIVTMATGDTAARGATALMQSLRDAGTRVPTLLVLLFRGGHGSEWCRNYERREARGRDINWVSRVRCAAWNEGGQFDRSFFAGTAVLELKRRGRRLVHGDYR